MPRSPEVDASRSIPFLRSVNVEQDAEYPERIIHYRPTGKGVAITRALAGLEDERAFLVIAPYGSGKSISATYLLHLLENRAASADALAVIQARLTDVSPELGEFAASRQSQPTRRGAVLALSGYQPSVAAALKTAALSSLRRLGMGRQARSIRACPSATIEQGMEMLATLQDKAKRFGLSTIAVVWDEFGQHVEKLLAAGQHSDLLDVQVLAEYVTRQSDPPVTLGVLMHQDLLGYARNVAQSVRNEWAKIEGRFRPIQYVDDSPEVYKLLADLVETPTPVPPGIDFDAIASESRSLGLFRGLGENELAPLLERAYPLEPTTLHLLPRLSARVAQNERTLFSFLCENDLQASITPAQLYEYFAPLMQVDGGLGGTQRRWIETESAISKATSTHAEAILKTTCLLNLGLSGERAHASLALLKFAARGYQASGMDDEIAALIERGLLLHRKHVDDISVWHGTDLDLRGKLGERKARRQSSFELIEFLNKEHPAPCWKPIEYNCERGIQRFFEGRYVTSARLEIDLVEPEFEGGLAPGIDGRVLYVICENAKDLSEASQRVGSVVDQQLLAALADGGHDLRDAAIEVQCLLEMQQDPALLDADPLAQAELRQMAEDSRTYLSNALGRFTVPSENGPIWYHAGQRADLHSAADVRSFLSEVMYRVFRRTPLILNENIVRHRPTPTIINARKKLVLGILERSGKPNLGIQGNFPDAAMFRSVLLNTGLYLPEEGNSGGWRFAEPNEVTDAALRDVWTCVKRFVTVPDEHPKKPIDLLDKLRRPPFGLRDGLLPIFLAAGFHAFPSALAIMREGEYLQDLLPTDIEELCREPERFRVVVFPEESAQSDCLQQILDVFAVGKQSARSGDLVRQAFDALQRWKEHLPPEALKTRQLSDLARAFQRAIMDDDPIRMLTARLPTLMNGWEGPAGLSALKLELESSGQVHYGAAAEVVRSVFPLEASEPLARGLHGWAGTFPAEFVQTLPIGLERRVLQTLADESATEEMLLDELATLVVQRPVHRWHDYTRTEFDLKLGGLVNRLERSLIATAGSNSLDPQAANRIARLLERRLTLLHEMVDRIGRSRLKTEAGNSERAM